MGDVQAVQTDTPERKHSPWRRAFSIGAPLVLIVATFGFAIPRLASYSQVIDTLKAMTTGWILIVAVATLVNLLANWLLIVAAVPGLSLRRAAAANLASTAVANTVPGGGAISLGISWRMLTGWGVSSPAFAAYAGVTGVWSALAKLATPGIALVILALFGGLSTNVGMTTALWIGATISTAAFIAGVVILRKALRDERAALSASRAAQRATDRIFKLLRRPAPQTVSGAVLQFRNDAQGLLETRGRRLTVAVILSDLGWMIVLQCCLLACGVPQSQVSWSRCLAGFALARLISTVPITPGGLGVIDLGLTTYLAAGLDPISAARVTAAVLLTRAVTFGLPIPLGAVIYTGWKFGRVRRSQEV